MTDQPTNLRVLKRSRRAPRAGDVFVALPPDGKYLFGRVIRTDALGPMEALLVYLFSHRSEAKEVPGDLSPDSLLIPPVLMNALGWYHGRFETIANVPLGPGDVLRQHCFYAAGRYYDESGETLAEATEPCGIGGVTSFRMLDDEISDALDLPRI